MEKEEWEGLSIEITEVGNSRKRAGFPLPALSDLHETADTTSFKLIVMILLCMCWC